MPVITYIAVDRGELVGGHTATTEYQIECELLGYERKTISKGSRDESLSGIPEGWLDALQYEFSIEGDLVLPSARANWREFISSVMNAEMFQIDFTGTIASPGTDVNVWLVSESVVEQQLPGFGSRYNFMVKAYPS